MAHREPDEAEPLREKGLLLVVQRRRLNDRQIVHTDFDQMQRDPQRMVDVRAVVAFAKLESMPLFCRIVSLSRSFRQQNVPAAKTTVRISVGSNRD